jgi:NAD(P)H dehydrogenase (quinone)
MNQIVVVYHSGAGHTEAIARSVARGVEEVETMTVEVLSVHDVGPFEKDAPPESAWSKLNNADAIIFGSPTYMGSVSGPFKSFMDATGALWYERKWMDKFAAGFTVGGGLSGDKQGTLQAMHTFSCQHGMIWVSMGIGVGEEGIDRLSSSIGMMAQADNGPPDQTPPAEDHLTAERFGHRVALATKRWIRER